MKRNFELCLINLPPSTPSNCKVRINAISFACPAFPSVTLDGFSLHLLAKVAYTRIPSDVCIHLVLNILPQSAVVATQKLLLSTSTDIQSEIRRNIRRCYTLRAVPAQKACDGTITFSCATRHVGDCRLRLKRHPRLRWWRIVVQMVRQKVRSRETWSSSREFNAGMWHCGHAACCALSLNR